MCSSPTTNTLRQSATSDDESKRKDHVSSEVNPPKQTEAILANMENLKLTTQPRKLLILYAGETGNRTF